eukprot:TRINITY_DN4006_c1_g1_i1.p1 TRINITY_DN4006_c1_g1~~TRINITY_DN4006_c1_g1_i1.p1  ORF type:complete len:695 (+),score=141.89 TRINITY_DN4006_c1_g1_i1:63-2147(+)
MAAGSELAASRARISARLQQRYSGEGPPRPGTAFLAEQQEFLQDLGQYLAADAATPPAAHSAQQPDSPLTPCMVRSAAVQHRGDAGRGVQEEEQRSGRQWGDVWRDLELSADDAAWLRSGTAPAPAPHPDPAAAARRPPPAPPRPKGGASARPRAASAVIPRQVCEVCGDAGACPNTHPGARPRSGTGSQPRRSANPAARRTSPAPAARHTTAPRGAPQPRPSPPAPAPAPPGRAAAGAAPGLQPRAATAAEPEPAASPPQPRAGAPRAAWPPPERGEQPPAAAAAAAAAGWAHLARELAGAPAERPERGPRLRDGAEHRLGPTAALSAAAAAPEQREGGPPPRAPSPRPCPAAATEADLPRHAAELGTPARHSRPSGSGSGSLCRGAARPHSSGGGAPSGRSSGPPSGPPPASSSASCRRSSSAPRGSAARSARSSSAPPPPRGALPPPAGEGPPYQPLAELCHSYSQTAASRAALIHACGSAQRPRRRRGSAAPSTGDGSSEWPERGPDMQRLRQLAAPRRQPPPPPPAPQWRRRRLRVTPRFPRAEAPPQRAEPPVQVWLASPPRSWPAPAGCGEGSVVVLSSPSDGEGWEEPGASVVVVGEEGEEEWEEEDEWQDAALPPHSAFPRGAQRLSSRQVSPGRRGRAALQPVLTNAAGPRAKDGTGAAWLDPPPQPPEFSLRVGGPAGALHCG